ncbi:MAG: beta-lactamase family protein [Gemmatimonadaceae bacterium]|jgi:CubicO group peptidase (beta-lactamase class C family)|nr:beta-lactamase family protein [Gemmatimonadaceae bacterium]
MRRRALLLAVVTLPIRLLAQDRTIDSLVRAHMATHRVPGAQVAIVRAGRITHLGAYGIADLTHAIPVRDETAFSIASATKSFSGVALMQLVETGKLTLDAPVSQFVDTLPAPWRAITIRQLATHTSGLPDMVNPESGALLAPSADSAWAQVQRLPMQSAPGTRWSYNQTNYWLLGRVVERVTQQPFTHVVGRQFTAAGMTSTTYGDIHDIRPNTADTYSFLRFRGDSSWRDTTLQRVVVEFAAPLRMAGGINASARDLARWLIALTRGTLLHAASRDTLWASPRMANGRILGDGDINGYGIGWPTFNDRDHPSVAGLGGGRAAFFLYPKDDCAVVVLTNLQGSRPEVLAQAIAARVLAR